MFDYIAPGVDKPLDISVFSRPGCEYCARAKGMLAEVGIEFETLELNDAYTDRTLHAISAATTVPQIFINGELIGGAAELETRLSEQKAQAA